MNVVGQPDEQRSVVEPDLGQPTSTFGIETDTQVSVRQVVHVSGPKASGRESLEVDELVTTGLGRNHRAG